PPSTPCSAMTMQTTVRSGTARAMPVTPGKARSAPETPTPTPTPAPSRIRPQPEPPLNRVNRVNLSAS
ncbi:MAG: hypothetical protein VW891_11825, partial [Novosphingobium sp.]